MPIIFNPRFTISAKTAFYLMEIEAVKTKIALLPITPKILKSLRETAKLYTTHYSTMIEGNRLDPEQIEKVLKFQEHYPGRKRDEHEVKGYFIALDEIEKWISEKKSVIESRIYRLHGLVMGNGKKTRGTPYRDGQNVIREGSTGKIVYLPPEAKDVPQLMKALILWIHQSHTEIPTPILAAVAHYQFATIHPYYDGNGRTARLLTTWILHLGGFDLKGIYSLEEYYARDLAAYYEALNIGPSHNYYQGRADADITLWIDYFIEGMAVAFQNVLRRMQTLENQNAEDSETLLRSLDSKQRIALSLFQAFEEVSSSQIGNLFNFKERTSSHLCKTWVEKGFLEVTNSSKRGRKYRLSTKYKQILNLS